MSSPSTPAARTCASCGAVGSGRFCAECGAAFDGATCAGCRAQLTPGAKFCHRCGTAVGTTPAAPDAQPRGAASVLPWGVAAIALLALIALVAGQRFATARGGSLDAPKNALPQAGLDDRGAAPFADAGGAPGRAPDISSMSPRQRADRLFDRVMRLHSEGKPDSVQLFAPMALAAYQMIDTLDLDLRYDYGRVAQVTGATDIAAAQADTILRANPTHLLGLILAAEAARTRGDSTAAHGFDRRLVAAEPAEMQRPLDEYRRHQQDILTAVAAARGAK